MRVSFKTLLLFALLVSACAPASVKPHFYKTKGPVEAKYQGAGPWGVSKIVSSEPCDREGNLCDIWYPTELGVDRLKGRTASFKHAVIAWANGTGQKPERYAYLLKHFASWGFVVVASREDGTGSGATTIDAANYIIRQGTGKPGGLLDGKIDAANIGVAGHSQGGATVAALLTSGAKPFKAYVTFHASPNFFAKLCCSVSMDKLKASKATGAVLHFGGSADPPAVQTDWYESTPATVTKALGILDASNHDDVTGNPGCQIFSSCVVGAYGYLGYSTAWFVWQLLKQNELAQVFSANGGEFVKPAAGWTTNRSNVR